MAFLKAGLYAFAAGAMIAAPANGAQPKSRLIVSPQTLFAMRVMLAHNQVRNAAGVRSAAWDPQLAAAADRYAAELARTERFEHSPAASRRGQGENLWMGTRGAFSTERMIADWASERRFYRAGLFPAVSRSGRWQDVAHYTQMIWPESVRIGCAVRSSPRDDYLVCRYSPGGNVIGAPLR